MTMISLCIWYLIKIWAALLLYCLAMAKIFGSSKSDGSSGLAQGLSGDPKGLYAVKMIPCWAQNSFNFFWFKWGWHST